MSFEMDVKLGVLLRRCSSHHRQSNPPPYSSPKQPSHPVSQEQRSLFFRADARCVSDGGLRLLFWVVFAPACTPTIHMLVT